MQRAEFSELLAFQAVADECSFTRAAARLNTSQSALSHAIRRLETRLGIRLLNRTTRSVAPTMAGDQLLETLRPALADIDAQLAALSQLQVKPAGTVRITTSHHAAHTVLWPTIARLLPSHPGLRVELSIDAALTDIVLDRYDAGVRLGEQVAKDMVAVRIGPNLRMAVVAAPSYLARHAAPVTPHDLTRHTCINVRLPTAGKLYVWEFKKDRRHLNVRVEGTLVFNDMSLALQAASEGFGLACVMQDQAADWIVQGKLVRLLEDWCPVFSGYYLYYPSRRQMSAAFKLLVDSLKYVESENAPERSAIR